MKFRKPTSPGDIPSPRGKFVANDRKRFERPDWLIDWIANKAKHVLLACGHKVDLKWHGQLVLEGLEGEDKGKVVTNCEKCSRFVVIERGLSWNEYHGKPTAVTPNEPLF